MDSDLDYITAEEEKVEINKTSVEEQFCGHIVIEEHSCKRDVLFVPGLKKNLVSVSMIEDRGYGVYVLDGKVHIFCKSAIPSDSRVIGVRNGKLCKLLFQPHHALSHTQSSDELCELWPRRMAHLHDPALRMLREMTTGMPEFST